MRRVAYALLMVGALAAAEATPPKPAPKADPAATAPAKQPAPLGVDPATARRAAELAERYERERSEAEATVDPEAQAKVADAEVALMEAETALAKGDQAGATKPFLAAGDALRAIPGDKRAGLAKRLRAADARLTKLAQAILAAPGVLPAGDAPVPDTAAGVDDAAPAHAAAGTDAKP